MSLNQFTTTQEVLDAMNAAFQVRAFLLDYANTTLVNRSADWTVSDYGRGSTIQVRRRSTTRGVRTDISTLNGPMTKIIQKVEQETIDIILSEFYNATFELNAVNQKLFLNGESANKETAYAAVDNLVFNVQEFLYDNLIKNANILALSPQTSLNNQTTLGRINVIANSHNMPEKRALMISNNAFNDLAAHFGSYLNDKASTPALRNRLSGLGMFDIIAGDNVVANFETGNAFEDNSTATLAVAAPNGTTQLSVNNMSNGKTINVGSPITFVSSTVRSVARGTFQVISTDVTRPSLIVAADPTLADFTPAVGNTPGFYTVGVAVSTQVTFKTEQAVQTSGNFQAIDAPSAIIPIGTPIRFYEDHVVSFMTSDTGISFTAPKLTPIGNATNVYSTHKDLSLRYSTQGDLLTETNVKELACIWGTGMDKAYLIRNMTAN